VRRRDPQSWVLLLTLGTVLVFGSVCLSAYADQRRFAAAQPWLDLAVRDLAGRLGTDTIAIRTQQVAAAEFSDSGLGVPEAGAAYLPVTTQGYVIRLVAHGSVYEYRAGGGRFLLVDPA
jgi:hypothetical protein